MKGAVFVFAVALALTACTKSQSTDDLPPAPHFVAQQPHHATVAVAPAPTMTPAPTATPSSSPKPQPQRTAPPWRFTPRKAVKHDAHVCSPARKSAHRRPGKRPHKEFPDFTV